MISNYLKVSLRNIIRQRSYSVINIVGLGIGLATCLLIFLWIHDEWKFDRFHSNSDRIFKVMVNNTFSDGSITSYGATPVNLAEVIQSDLPEVEIVSQTSMDTELLLKSGEKAFLQNGIYSDQGLFQIFSFPIVKGDNMNPVANKKAIAISENLSQKLFGNSDPIGRVILVEGKHDMMVSSVFLDLPSNSSLQFDFVLPFDLFKEENPWTKNWQSGGSRTYVALYKDADLDAANQKISNLIKKNCPECISNPFLFQFTKYRLYNKFENGQIAGGRIDQVWLFSVIGMLILIMACINFMNLATARSTTRGKEIGIRKAIGAGKAGLIKQFLLESILLSFFGLVVAIVLVILILPYFNELTEKNISLENADSIILFGVVLLTLACGLLAGSYPAFFLSSFKPVAVLKGDSGSQLKGTAIRKSLVVGQLALSTILIIGSLAVYKQIEFISNKNLGYQKEQIIVIDAQESQIKNHEAFKNELKNFGGIESVGFGGSDILSIPITANDITWNGKSESDNITFKILRCDEDFLPTMGIPFVAGSNFSPDQNPENPKYIINRRAMEAMGIPKDEIIGSEIEAWHGLGQVIGVTEDFHNNSLRENIEPMVFMYSQNVGFHYYVRTNPEYGMEETLSHMEGIIKKYSPDYPFGYTFLDEAFQREYQMEQVIGKLSMGFTGIAVLIACMGLFGLSSFSASKRVKEMGIRKVMGASSSQLVLLLGRDFFTLVFLGVLLGFPLAWYFSKMYLAGFAFHTQLTVWAYLFTTLSLLGIALLSVFYQSIKVALSNPVDSLRNE
ncbi:ABC transporter permease [Aquiflexum sp. TKW24L]|uniref:ABC transporter permease n=1 Tax=Aquiflexum sp. TKW24L TaxID=2942212 RepID=UPI0020BD5B37|nr:ABC transporter permease [Aquiflexum sp. TKW24L]MCL6258165.1 ABC transporter permease [Aquiflexum sp. TKW24L]